MSIDFSPSVTILTGRNGTGKTTLLNILAQHSSYHTEFLSSPPRPRDKLGRFTSGVWLWLGVASSSSDTHDIGEIVYWDDQQSRIQVNHRVDVHFSPTLTPAVSVSVLNIPSHRRLPPYKKVEFIPTAPITRELALQNYQKDFWGGVRGDIARPNPLTKMKEALISMAAFGPGNERVQPNFESFSAFEEFEKRLRQIIPKNIGFRRIVVQIPDVIIETDSGRFLIDASSGGLMSLIDITWQITLFGRSEGEFVVLIDEPENHLHPSMQREILPALTRAFPEAQFIIATHSPFIVSSVRDAKVYVFDVDDRPTVPEAIAEDLSSERNSVVALPIDISDHTSASAVLREALGVPISVPIWAEEELQAVLDKYRGKDLTPNIVRDIHSDLSERGLSDFFPELVARAAGQDA